MLVASAVENTSLVNNDSSQTLTSTRPDESVRVGASTYTRTRANSRTRVNRKANSRTRVNRRANSRTMAYRRARALSSVSFTRGRGIGDCWVNSEHLFNRLTGSGIRARIIQYRTSLSPRHRSVQVYQNGAWVDYDYRASGYARRYFATRNKPGLTVIRQV